MRRKLREDGRRVLADRVFGHKEAVIRGNNIDDYARRSVREGLSCENGGNRVSQSFC